MSRAYKIYWNKLISRGEIRTLKDDPAKFTGLDAVKNYIGVANAGGRIKPLIVLKEQEKRYLLLDGFHRLAAHYGLNWETVVCHVKEIRGEGSPP